MCGHEWKKQNDLTVCIKCGLIRTYDGKVIFDRTLPDILKKPMRRKEKV